MHIDWSLPFSDPVLIIALVMSVVLLAPLLFSRLRVPGLIGLLVAGVVIGPHALGLLEREGTIQVLGTIGLLYIMFLAGLEVDLNEFARHRRQSIQFGALTFFFPQTMGLLMARFVLGFDWGAALLLGSLFASHTLLAYPIVSRMGLSRQPAVTTGVGATIITDTAALLVLAIVAGAWRGGLSPLFLGQLFGFLAIYVLAVLWGLPRIGRWFFRTVRAGDVPDFVFILAAVFLVSFLAEVAGVEAIIGAFLAGLALNRLVPETGPLMQRIVFVGEALFIPFFLISTGMIVDLDVLTAGAGAWVVAGSMLATVITAKFLASLAMRPLGGYTATDVLLTFGLTIPQAAATLAAALVGYDLGIFDDNVLNGTIVMILVTCILGPAVAERAGRRLAMQLAQDPRPEGERPQRILVPLANPETAPALMDVALAIRNDRLEQPVYPLTVVMEGPGEADAVARGEKLLAHAVVHAAAANVPVVPLTRVDYNVARGMSRAVRERRASTVVIGWNGESSARALVFGSVLDQFLDESAAGVFVCRLVHPLTATGRVLLLVPPFAEREPGFLETATDLKTLASRVGSPLVLVTVASAVPDVQARLKSIRPDVPLTTLALPSWSDLMDALAASVLPDDLIALVSVRRGTVAWRPGLLRLPRLIAARFPLHDFITAYLSEADLAQSVADALGRDGSASLGALIDERHIALGLDERDPGRLLARLVALRLPDRSDVLGRFVTPDPDESPEITPGVVLYHTYTDAVEEPALLVGTVAGEGTPVPRASHPARVVLALLAPRTLSFERYLHLLALAAQLVRTEHTLSALANAATPAQARAVLLAASRQIATPDAAAPPDTAAAGAPAPATLAGVADLPPGSASALTADARTPTGPAGRPTRTDEA
ncbi:MAG: cation:proton antiporter [Rubricoccaceae bacterium]